MKSGAGMRAGAWAPGPAKLAAAAILVVAGAAASFWLWRGSGRHASHSAPAPADPGRPPDEAVLAFLNEIPLYRALVRAKAVRSGRVDSQGVLHVEVDLRALAGPRLQALGFPDASGLIPAAATGTIAVSKSEGTASPGELRESWSIDGPAAVLDLLDRRADADAPTIVWEAIPGAPSAVAYFCIDPSRLADPRFGGPALASWRDRVDLAEKLLGRPLRAELSEDLAGPAVFALYEGTTDSEAEVIVAAQLRRSDRIGGLLDLLFGLGALTERASVGRYRGVSTGSFSASTGGGGLALAVDGPVLLLATSRARLESAIDSRRAGSHPVPTLAGATERDSSWSAVSASAFVKRGWSRLAHASDETHEGPIAATTATLRPEGVAGWRLDGHGPAPAITADPMLPFFRALLGRRQRGAD